MPKAVGLAPVTRLAFLLRAIKPWRLANAYEREVCLVAAVGLTAFYWTALASFTPVDASWVAVSFPDAAPENLAGTLGANLSGLAIFTFGFIAWLLPLPLLTSALLIVRKSPAAAARSRLLGWGLGLACLAAFAALRFPVVTWRGFDFPSGGVIGSVLARYLVFWLGQIGGFITIATVALCAVLLVFRQSLFEPLHSRLNKLRKPLWWDKVLHPAFAKASAGEPVVESEPEEERIQFAPTLVEPAETPPVFEPGALEPDYDDEPLFAPLSRPSSPSPLSTQSTKAGPRALELLSSSLVRLSKVRRHAVTTYQS